MPERARQLAVSGDRDDSVLVAAACAGDDASFEALFRRHAPDIIRFIERRSGSPAVADDVVAVTFEKAWRQVCEISSREIRFRPWIFRLASNELIDQQRGANRRRRREVVASASDLRLAGAGNELDITFRDEELREAISTLSASHQEVVALRWFADLTPNEVAQALGVTPGTAAVRTHRALAALRRALGAAVDGSGDRGHEVIESEGEDA